MDPMVFSDQKMMKDWIFGEFFESLESFELLRRSGGATFWQNRAVPEETRERNEACQGSDCVRLAPWQASSNL
jgi:hypothetical protein